MDAATGRSRRAGVLRSLVGLLAASLICALVLTVSISDGPAPRIANLDLGSLVVLVVFAGVLTFLAVAGTLFLRAARRAREARARAEAEVAQLQRRVQNTEAMLRLEPQALIVWEQGQAPHVHVNTLPPELKLPRAQAELVRFSAWLAPEAMRELNPALERLIKDGQPFNLTLATRQGPMVEADGRAAGTRVVLKLREASGPRRQLAEAEGERRGQARQMQLQRALFEAMPTPVWTRGQDSRLDWVNLAYVRAVGGQSREDVKLRQVELLEARQQQGVDQALKSGRVYRERVRVVVGGERRAYDLLGVPLERSVAMIASDAAALETAEGALNRQMAATDRTLDRVSTAVAIFGRDQRLVFHNDAYRKLWQLEAEWLTTHPTDGEILDRLREMRRVPEEADYRAWKRKQLICYGTTAEHEDWWHLAGGRTVHVVGEQRQDGGVTYLYDDVTEKMALESSFKTLSSVQRETLDHLREGVAVFATDGRLGLSNPAFARIWKLNPNDLARQPHVDEVIRRCRGLYEDDRTWLKLKRAVTAISDQRQRIEGEMRRPDGSVIAYAGLPLPDGAMLLTFIDVTDTKRMENALIERNEALETAGRLKSQFISHVSYELRTPLTNIIGFSELLLSPRTGELNGKQREYMGDIGVSSRTLLAIINDILDLATIDAGTLELKLAPVEIASAVEDVVKGVRERLTRARQKLEIDLAPTVRSFIGDEARVKQILYNLLSNAIGFSEPGDTIKLRCARDGVMVAFVVEDEGAGIPAAQLPRVFDRFESRPQGSKHRGTGLGLAMVKSLVELHGGDIKIVSIDGKGTKVTVRFPEGQRNLAPAPGASRPPILRGRARNVA